MNVIVYSHPSVLGPLGSGALRAQVGSLLVELAPEPNLTVTLGLDTPTGFPGLAGLLGGQVALDDLKVEHPSLPAPIVLGPGKRLSPHLLSAAVAQLDDAGASAGLTLLVHVDDAAAFKGALARASAVAVAWDEADLPNESLPELAEFLASEDLLGGDAWKGLFLYGGEGRPARPEVARALEGWFPGA